MADELPIELFAGPDEFRAWLQRNHAATGTWLKLAKKGSAVTTLTYDEALDDLFPGVSQWS